MIITTFLKIFFKNNVFLDKKNTEILTIVFLLYFTVYLKHAIRCPTVDHDNYDKFDKNDTYNNVNYDILKIEALGYHDNYDVFEKYFSKTMYFPMYLTHWNFSRFKYVVFYTNLDTRTGENDSRPVNYDIL